jgi:hypothetical protein
MIPRCESCRSKTVTCQSEMNLSQGAADTALSRRPITGGALGRDEGGRTGESAARDERDPGEHVQSYRAPVQGRADDRSEVRLDCTRRRSVRTSGQFLPSRHFLHLQLSLSRHGPICAASGLRWRLIGAQRMLTSGERTVLPQLDKKCNSPFPRIRRIACMVFAPLRQPLPARGQGGERRRSWIAPTVVPVGSRRNV